MATVTFEQFYASFHNKSCITVYMQVNVYSYNVQVGRSTVRMKPLLYFLRDDDVLGFGILCYV